MSRLSSMLSGSSPTTDLNAEQLLEQFVQGNSRQRRNLIQALESRIDEIASIGNKIFEGLDPRSDDWAAGWILQLLQRHHPEVITMIDNSLDGWYEAKSSEGIDYTQLQKDLLLEQFEAADRLMSKILRCLA